MEIYTLTGPSGTGKSYRAMDICKQYNIDGVIDDGLFIYKGMVTAGESAKRCETKIGAVKAAIFKDEKKDSESIVSVIPSNRMTGNEISFSFECVKDRKIRNFA